jgi:hypothetical protein
MKREAGSDRPLQASQDDAGEMPDPPLGGNHEERLREERPAKPLVERKRPRAVRVLKHHGHGDMVRKTKKSIKFTFPRLFHTLLP